MTDTFDFNYSEYPQAHALEAALTAYEVCENTIRRLIATSGDVTEMESAQARLERLQSDVQLGRSHLWLAIVEHGIDGTEARRLVDRFQVQVTGGFR